MSDPIAKKILEQLYKERDSKGEITIYLPLTTISIAEFVSESYQAGILSNKIPNEDLNLPDINLVHELKRLKILKTIHVGGGENGDSIAIIRIIDVATIEELYELMTAVKHFLHYGIFSLNTVTGDAYCNSFQTRFHPSRGLFRVFKGFLDDSTDHKLSHIEILSRSDDEPEDEIKTSEFYTETTTTMKANQIIKDIKRSLGMKRKLSKLFRAAGKEYTLLPGVDLV